MGGDWRQGLRRTGPFPAGPLPSLRVWQIRFPAGTEGTPGADGSAADTSVPAVPKDRIISLPKAETN